MSTKSEAEGGFNIAMRRRRIILTTTCTIVQTSQKPQSFYFTARKRYFTLRGAAKLHLCY